MAALDAIRWLERVTYHAWRACRYLAEQGSAQADDSVGAPAPLDE